MALLAFTVPLVATIYGLVSNEMEDEPPVADPGPTRSATLLQPGDSAPYLDYDGTEVGTVTLEEVDPDLACTSEFDEPPQNGRFVGLKLSVTVVDDLPDDHAGIFLSSHRFDVVTADGSIVNDPIGESYLCLSNRDVLPSLLESGQKGTGWLVFDAPEEPLTLHWPSESYGDAGYVIEVGGP